MATFPPAAPTMPKNVIPSYVYCQFNDDDDVQAFCDSYNEMAQGIYDWFNQVQLPVYTGLSGDLLDWIGQGIYGMARPILSLSVAIRNAGPYNTLMLNDKVFDYITFTIPPNYVISDDDIYKRVLTWHLYKGDGKTFNIRWLKRRVMRFLLGGNGSAPNVDDTSQVKITFEDHPVNIQRGVIRVLVAGPFNTCALNSLPFNADVLNSTEWNIVPAMVPKINIHILRGPVHRIVLGALNTYCFNSFRMNTGTFSLIKVYDTLPFLAQFKEGIDSGVLELPFQFNCAVTI